jgi:uncharacterized hydrophobic protein (TIGR00271 family)
MSVFENGPAPVAGPRGWFTLESDTRLDPVKTRELVVSGASMSAPYFLMNAAATLIAGYGLLADSVAVVIGAMLIAMLYGPILGLGFAMATADTRLLARSLAAEITGAAWVLSLGLALGLMHGEILIGEQILARTAPNLLDLMIALVGGAAGAYATISTRISGAVVGVAIATALCPPLTACGILIAHGQIGLAGGAFLLFFTNLMAIAVGAMVVFLLAGYRAVFSGDGGHVPWTARGVSLGALIALAAYLGHNLNAAVDDSTLRNRAHEALTRAAQAFPGARIVEIRLRQEGGKTGAFAVIRSAAPLSTAQVGVLDDALDRAVGRDLDLHVRLVRVDEMTRAGPVFDLRWPQER